MAESVGHTAPDFFSLTAHPAYTRGITHLALDTPDVLGLSFPVVEAMIERRLERTGTATAEFRTRIFASVTGQLTWALFSPMLEASLGYPSEELQPAAAEYLARMCRDD